MKKLEGYLLTIVLIISMLIPMDVNGANVTVETLANAEMSLNNELSSTDYVEGEVLIKYTSNENHKRLNFKKNSNTEMDFGKDISVERTWDLGIEDVLYGKKASKQSKTSSFISLLHSKTKTTNELIHELSQLQNVEYVEPNYWMHALGTTNDTYTDKMWQYKNKGNLYEGTSGTDMKIEEAWTKASKESEVVVAVIDSGVDYTHPDLKDNMWLNQTTLEGNFGYDFVNHDADPMDDYGHGTHCAGSIAATANNNIGIAGVARNTKIMALKYMDHEGNGKASDAVDAYAYIIEAKRQGTNIVAINNSWGGSGNPKALEEAIEAAGKIGILSICAAGNTADNIDVNKTYPAAYDTDYTIVVGASTPDDQLADFSCFGKSLVDVTAPGTNILSTVPYDSYIPGYAYKDQSFYGFEDNRNPFIEKELVTYSQDHVYEGKRSIKWHLTEDDGDDGSGNTKNILTLSPVYLRENSYFGFSYRIDIKDTLGEAPEFLVEIKEDGQWVTLESCFSLSMNSWISKSYKIKSNPVEIRFTYHGAGSNTDIYFDNMGYGLTTGKYEYMHGTSMAAPIVAGEAALLSAINPTEQPSTIRARIIGGVDRSPAFVGKVAADGRINIEKALNNPNPVMNSYEKSGTKQLKIKGRFFGTNKGKLKINGKDLTILKWSKNEITVQYSSAFDGYAVIEVTRSRDLVTATGNFLILNPDYEWEKMEPMPIGVETPCVTASGDYLYVFGGMLEDYNPNRSMYRYDTNNNTWKKMASLPMEKQDYMYSYGGTAATANGQIVALFYNAATNKNLYLTYDIKKDEWKKMIYKNIPSPRNFATLVTYNKQIYMIGGMISSSDQFDYKVKDTNEVWVLDQKKNSWYKSKSMKYPRYYGIAAQVDGSLVVTGGEVGSEGKTIQHTEIFDGKSWKSGPKLPINELSNRNTVSGGGSKLTVMTDGISYSKAGFSYDLKKNKWTEKKFILSHDLYLDFKGTQVNGYLYTVGGSESDVTSKNLRRIKLQ